MAFFFLWYLFWVQRYSSFSIMQILSLMTLPVVHVQGWETKLRISLPIMKQCYWNLAGMLHPTKTFWCCYGNMLGSSLFLFKIRYYHLRLNKVKYLVLSKTYANPTFIGSPLRFLTVYFAPCSYRLKLVCTLKPTENGNIIHLQHLGKFCVSVPSHFRLKTQSNLFYFLFSHIMKTWAKYRNHWKILR